MQEVKINATERYYAIVGDENIQGNPPRSEISYKSPSGSFWPFHFFLKRYTDKVVPEV